MDKFPTVQFFKIVCLHWPHVAELLTITLAEFHSQSCPKASLSFAKLKSSKVRQLERTVAMEAPFSRTPVLIIISSSSFLYYCSNCSLGQLTFSRTYCSGTHKAYLCWKMGRLCFIHQPHNIFLSELKMKLPFPVTLYQQNHL